MQILAELFGILVFVRLGSSVSSSNANPFNSTQPQDDLQSMTNRLQNGNASYCFSSPFADIPEPESNELQKLIASSRCVNVYNEVNCRGDFIRLRHAIKGGEFGQTHSIGPCDEECSPAKVDEYTAAETRTSVVTLIGDDPSHSTHYSFEVSGCVFIPFNQRDGVHGADKVASIFFNTSLCLELYTQKNCKGNSLQLVGRNSNDFTTLSPFREVRVSSLSHCGYKCIGKPNRTFTLQGEDVVTISDGFDMEGKYKHVNLSRGCQNFMDEWQGQVDSILTFGQCVKIYNKFGCNDKYGESTMLNGSTTDFTNIPSLIVLSMKKCGAEAEILYAEISGYQKTGLFMDVSACKSLPFILVNIYQVDAYNGCIDAFEKQDCNGNHIRLLPNEINLVGYWSETKQTKLVGSIGPCQFDECSSTKVQHKPENNSKITIFNEQKHKGHNLTLNIQGCHLIPREFERRVRSIEFLDDVCIELHEYWNCTGRSIQEGHGSRNRYIPSDNSLESDEKYAVPAQSVLSSNNPVVSSISLCEYKCRMPIVTTKQPLLPPGPNIVKIFDEQHFQGNAKDLQITGECLNVTKEWEESRSILTYDICAIAYNRFGCSKYSKTYQFYSSNYNSQTSFPFTWGIKSIKKCFSNSVIYVPSVIIIGIASFLSVCPW